MIDRLPAALGGAGAGGGPAALSTTALVIANLAPVLGVLFDDWSVADIMLLYWAESGVIGVWNLAKLQVIGGWRSSFAGIFFVGHFGAFMAAHLLFIYALFIDGIGPPGLVLSEVERDLLLLTPALICLFISHGISFFVNFIGRREFAHRELGAQLVAPYSRIMVMHFTLLFGGLVTMALGDALPALLLMIVLKTGADLRSHLREHAGTATAAS